MSKIIVKKLSLIITIPLIFLVVFLYVQKNNSENIDKASGITVNSFKKSTLEEYKNQIKEYGPEYAYQVFKDGTNQSHSLAHLFGEALFYTSGPDGVGSCDDSFEFGCYHGFFLAGIQGAGMDIIYKFDEACRQKGEDKFLPCQHGIGHGIMSYGVPIKEALGWCKKITWHPTGGCASGVFMEYNFPALMDHSGTALRKVEEGRYFSPCTEVLVEFKNGCYFELPQWWLFVFDGDLVKIGSLCGEVKNIENKQWCFHGIGNYATSFAGYDVSRIISICNSLPKDGREWCREGSSWILLSRPEANADIRKLCDGSEECLRKLKQNPFYENK